MGGPDQGSTIHIRSRDDGATGAAGEARMIAAVVQIPQRKPIFGGNLRGRSPPRPLPIYASHPYTRTERRDTMATLSVLKFNDPYGAERVMVALQGMQERELITLEDAAIVSWPQGNKKPKTRELHGGSAGWGAFWGFLIGMIFFVPFLGAA